MSRLGGFGSPGAPHLSPSMLQRERDVRAARKRVRELEAAFATIAGARLAKVETVVQLFNETLAALNEARAALRALEAAW